MRTIVTLALAAGAALGGGLLAQSRVTAAAPETRVAVVDQLGVMSTHPRKAQIEAKNRDTKSGIEKFLDDEQKRIETLKDKARVLSATDPSRAELEKQIAHDMVVWKFEKEWRLEQAQRDYFNELEILYDEVRAEIKNVAMAMGYAIVFNKTDDRLEVSSSNEFYLNIGIRPVIYYDKTVDLTAAVKERISARGGTPPGTPPVAPPPPPPAMGSPVPPPAMGGALPPPAMG